MMQGNAKYTLRRGFPVMKNVLALQWEIQPPPRQTCREFQVVVRDRVAEWLRGVFEGLGVKAIRFPFDGSCGSPLPGHEFRCDEQECGTHRLTTLEWEFPEATDPDVVWRFSGLLACNAHMVQVSLLIQARWRMRAFREMVMDLKPHNPLVSIAVLRNRLLEWPCFIEGQPIPTHALLVHENNVDWFVNQMIRSPRRILPILLLRIGSMPPETLEPYIQRLQVVISGFAQVVYLPDGAALGRFEMLVSLEQSPRDYLLCVYWPVLTNAVLTMARAYQIPAGTHATLDLHQIEELARALLGTTSGAQYQEGQIIRAARAALAADRAARLGREVDLQAAERELEKARTEQLRLHKEAEASAREVRTLQRELIQLREQVAELRAAGPPASPLQEHIDALKAEKAAAVHRILNLLDEKESLLKELNESRNAQPPKPTKTQADYDELAVEVERLWDENETLRADWDETRQKLQDVDTDFRLYVDRSATLWDAREESAETSASKSNGRTYASVLDALRAAGAEFKDVLVVWEDAESSAAVSIFFNPGKVFQVLSAVAEVGRAYFKAKNGGPPLGPVDQAFRSRVPCKYTSFESQTTRNLFGADRVFHHHGLSMPMQRHFTMGGGQTSNCLQIYIEFDDAAQRILIGYCGRHLPYAGQRT
jgi:hypothetical protein